MPNRQGTVAEESEHTLLPLIARGDEAAAGELYRRCGEQVMRFVYRRVGEQLEDAEEVTLDTFVSAVSLAASFDPRSSVLTWLCGIAKLRIVDYYRKKDRGKRVPDSMTEKLDEVPAGNTMEHILDRLEARQVVDAMLAELSRDEREAILLRYVEGFSIREAALLMKRSEKGVESLLTRAKAKARAAMEQSFTGGVR